MCTIIILMLPLLICANCIIQDTDWTPLLLAVDESHTDVLELLIKHGAKLDIKNKVIFVGKKYEEPILMRYICSLRVTNS